MVKSRKPEQFAKKPARILKNPQHYKSEMAKEIVADFTPLIRRIKKNASQDESIIKE